MHFLDQPDRDARVLTRRHRIRLHDMFPMVPIADIKQVLLSCEHSFLYNGADKLVKKVKKGKFSVEKENSGWLSWLWSSKADDSARRRSNLEHLEPEDLFRSPEHEAALVNELLRMFPHVPAWLIKQRVAEGGSFVDMCRDAQEQVVKQPKLKAWLNDLFYSSPASTSAGQDRGRQEAADEINLALRELQRKAIEADATLARQLNTEWADEDHLLYECGCCFAEVAFEDLTFCSKGSHQFCRDCLNRQVEQHAFGGAPLATPTGDPGSGSGVRCLSIEGCQAPFSARELERALDRRVLEGLNKRQNEAVIESLTTTRGGKVARCPFCSYAEIEHASNLSKLFPIWFEPPSSFDRLAVSLAKSVLAVPTLLLVWLLLFVAVSVFPDSFTSFAVDSRPLFPLVEVTRTARLAWSVLLRLNQDTIKHKGGYRNTFQCKNHGLPLAVQLGPGSSTGAERVSTRSELVRTVWPSSTIEGGPYCGKLSCRLCQKEYVDGIHKCFEDEQDGLRLVVERARTLAIKRTCHRCGLAFTKESGCNKMVCRCGAIQCFVCRRDIASEGYQHFCQHFLPDGGPCRQCDKCSLWKAASDQKAADVAGEKARQEWLASHGLSDKARAHVLSKQDQDLVKLYTTSAVAFILSLLL